jgi:hypothetical protein
MANPESPYESVVGRGSRGTPFTGRQIFVLATFSIAAVIALLIISSTAPPRPDPVVFLGTVAILWLLFAYFAWWRDVMLRVYRRLAALPLTDQQRLVRWLLAFFGFIVFSVAWMSALILLGGRPA